MSTEIDDLERHVRSIWPDLGKPRPALAEEDRAIAAKLLGKENFQRLSRAKSGDRVKYRTPVVTAEYHCFPSATMAGVEHWVITLIEDGKRRPLNIWFSYEDCLLGIRWLESKGVPAKRIETEYMRHRSVPPAKAQQDRSKRFDADWLRRATS
jgi:hypothetical protein